MQSSSPLPHSRTFSRLTRGLIGLLALLLVTAACAGPAQPASTALPTPLPSATLQPSATFPPTLTPTTAPTSTSTPAPCTATAGEVRREELLSPYLNKPLNYRVYLPPCFDDSGETRYPVLYMLHGQTYNDDQWVRLGINTTADQLISSGAIRPFLIVMPYEVDTFADPYNGGYRAALLETLIPWINAFFPVCPERECRAIGGLSRGGAYAVLLALDHPELFVQAGGHSVVPFGGMENRLTRQLAVMPAGQFPRLSTDMGQNDIYLPNLRDYEKLLTQLEVPHEFTINPGNHDENYWASHVEEYLRWYAAGFPQD